MYSLSHYTSFRVLAEANQLDFVHELADLQALSLAETDDFVILGEGSNILFTADYMGRVIVNKMDSLFINEMDDCAYITAGAGMNWHYFVTQMSTSGFYGLENLAYIPGTVGAAPVQNIGAYGVEVASFIDEVIAFDLRTQSVIKFKPRQCDFAYRMSNFKHDDWRRRYVIIAVTFLLSKIFSPVISYKELAESFTDTEFSAEDLLNKVISIRQQKLPNHHEIPNAGSFFKNPVIDAEVFESIIFEYPEIPFYPLDNGMIKIPAAWLLERLDYKGLKRDDGAGVYEKHALILINHNQASGEAIYRLACDMIADVKKQFKIQLEPEVRLIGT